MLGAAEASNITRAVSIQYIKEILVNSQAGWTQTTRRYPLRQYQPFMPNAKDRNIVATRVYRKQPLVVFTEYQRSLRAEPGACTGATGGVAASEGKRAIGGAVPGHNRITVR